MAGKFYTPRLRLPRFALRTVSSLALGLFLGLQFSSACGPDFPNNLLTSGDAAVLSAPTANFARELERLQLAPSRFSYIAPQSSHEEQSRAADLADLEAALKRTPRPELEIAAILAQHRTNRLTLDTFREAYARWEHTAWMADLPSLAGQRPEQPTFPQISATAELPAEFATYFSGFLAWHQPQRDLPAARAAWEQVLALPAAERKFKSTWAAFMLGRSWETENPAKASAYFQRTRQLVRQGFTDSLGLATAALGREARVELHQQHYQRALQLYLEQLAAEDPSAVQSLRLTAAQILAEPNRELPALATNATSRLVITAYLISHPGPDASAEDPSTTPNAIRRWLEAVEAANVRDVESAERLALAAYQAGEFELAQRWITRARHSVTTQWLQAKLHLRAGKIHAAAALLAQVTRARPVLAAPESEPATDFADQIFADADSWRTRPSREQMLGELGVLALARGEFTQALDALLRAGFWDDAAYVAERVLTTDELKHYVDHEWPFLPAPAPDPAPTETDAAAPVYWGRDLRTDTQRLRYLLARRLTRESRGLEAHPYFPQEWQPPLAALTAALDVGWDEARDAATRARALFTAAVITRTNGMELLGTELAPDWFIYGGSYEGGLSWPEREAASADAQINVPMATESLRAQRHGTDPEQRFHYRYQAALLAWEAAKLLPNNSDETARILCTAGTWLKVRDPETADLFYKALVRRCRQTAIGAQADAMRWFPVLDEHGQPKPYQPRPPAPEIEPAPEFPEPNSDSETTPEETMPANATDTYIIQSGDTLAHIAAAATALGRQVTVADLRAANPELDGTRLRVGQRITLPR